MNNKPKFVISENVTIDEENTNGFGECSGVVVDDPEWNATENVFYYWVSCPVIGERFFVPEHSLTN